MFIINKRIVRVRIVYLHKDAVREQPSPIELGMPRPGDDPGAYRRLTEALTLALNGLRIPFLTAV